MIIVYNKPMNTKLLKWIALILMTIDHIGVHLITNESLYLACRVIGRGAFPLYAFMLVNGFIHTKNMRKYFLRLFSIALLIELTYLILYLNGGDNFLLSNNIFITLTAALLGLIAITNNKQYNKALIFPIIITTYYLNFDGSLYALFMVLGFYIFKELHFKILFLVGLNALFIFTDLMPTYQWASVLFMFILYFYNNQYGKVNRLFHYLYYPGHILVILLIKYFIR